TSTLLGVPCADRDPTDARLHRPGTDLAQARARRRRPCAAAARPGTGRRQPGIATGPAATPSPCRLLGLSPTRCIANSVRRLLGLDQPLQAPAPPAPTGPRPSSGPASRNPGGPPSAAA